MRISDWSSDVCSSDLLSAPYRFSGRDVPYDDVTVPARRLIAAAPERMLWATDWPHSAAFPPNQQPKRTMPNDGSLLDLLEVWAPDAATRRKILVDRSEEHTSELQSLMRISYAV